MGMSQSKLNQEHVIAIEIGSMNSGYAYHLGDQNCQTLTATYGYGLPKDRVPTALLLKSDRTFDSFGTFAKDKYYALVLQEQEEHGYIYVDKEQIKPTPCESASVKYKVDIEKEDSITQEEIYAKIIKYLHERHMHQIKRYGQSEVMDPLLVFTVPGNNDETKSKFMISAAKKAGLEKNVMVILEMDAAASYCSQQFLCADRSASAKRMSKTAEFVVLDLGGYTTQFCFYKISEKHNVQPLRSVVCLPFAGETVTESFIRELESMVCEEKRVSFKETYVSDYLDIVRSFEHCKRTFDSSTPAVIMEMPPAVFSLMKSEENKTTDTGICLKENNKILITREKISNVFDESLSKIVEKLQSYSKDNVEMVLLVGGFSESSYVREYIAKKMGSVPVVLVPEPDLAVLKGAVTMGYENCLRSDFAYGFNSMEPLTDEQADSTEMMRKGENCSEGEFIKVICKYEFVSPYTFPVEHILIRETDKHNDIVFYKTENPDVVYFNTETKKYFSEVTAIKAPTDGWQDKVNVQLKLAIVRNDLKFTAEVVNQKKKRF